MIVQAISMKNMKKSLKYEQALTFRNFFGNTVVSYGSLDTRFLIIFLLLHICNFSFISDFGKFMDIYEFIRFLDWSFLFTKIDFAIV